MSSSRSLTVALAAAIALSAVACNKDKRTPTTPVDPTPPPTVVETFSGSIEMSGTSCHPFAVVERGDASIKLTALAPLSTLTVGVSVGRPDETAATGCVAFATDRSVRVLETLVTAGLEAGDYCVCVLDVGNIFPDTTVTYSVEVEHP